MTPEPTTEETALTALPSHGRDTFVSVTTLLVGALTVLGLFRYNYQNSAVWAMGRLGPTSSWEEYLLVNVAALVFLPFLLILGLFKEGAEGYGFRPSAPGGARYAWIFLTVMAPCILVASRFPDFKLYYPRQPMAAMDGHYLLYFEVTYGFYLFCWEYFYRGFLTFGLARRFGVVAAIVLQAAAFGALHYGKPAPEFAGSFIAGIALGWLAWRCRSFLPGFLLHWFISISFDLLAIHGRPGALF